MKDARFFAQHKGPFTLKYFAPRTLFSRSLLILIIPLVLVQAITVFMFFDRHWSKISSRLAFAVAGEVTLITKLIDGEKNQDTLQQSIALAAQNFDFLVSVEPGASLGPPRPPVAPPLFDIYAEDSLKAELQAVLRKPFVLSLDFKKKWVQIDIQVEQGVLQVSVPQRRLFSSSGYIVLLWMAGSSFILLMIAVVFMRNQIRPIRKLAAAAERFGKGRDVSQFRPQGAVEVRQAGQAFLIMQARIKRQIEQRTAMLAGVSHDLRTPLTRLKLQLAMMPESPDVQHMKGDIETMERMIAGYLDFMRGGEDEPMVMTSLNGLIGQCATAQTRHGTAVDVDIKGDIAVMLQPNAFERCLANLVGNAGKYGSHVYITASQKHDLVEIKIEDNGPGIPPDQYADVFKPFYRVDQSRNLSTGGVGLGLPIAMDIVSAHGGTITLGKSDRGGLCVTVVVPV